MSNEIGGRLRTQRKRRGWPQAHLATAAGVSIRRIQRIEEAGTSTPVRETLLALAAALDVDVGVLRVGATAEHLHELQGEYLCPHRGSKLVARIPVAHEYGMDSIEEFGC